MDVAPGTFTYREIVSQGEAWSASLAAMAERAPDLGAWLRRPRTEVLFTGCGSTYYLSLVAAVVWQTLTGTRARAAPASELWLFPDSLLSARPSLLIAVSRSAETTETLRAVDIYHSRAGDDILVVTCYGDRPLTNRGLISLVADRAQEESIVQTRSFTSMLLLIQFAAGLTAGRDDYLAWLQTLPAHVNRMIKENEALVRTLAADMDLQHFVFLGSGPNYGLACEAMLKMKEMSLSPSEAFHFLEFRHGPKSAIGPETLVVGIVSDRARDQEAAVLAEMRELGAQVLAVAETARGLPADFSVALRSGTSTGLGAGVGDLARGPLVLPVLQLLAYHRAMAKGLNPDHPTNLEAVVRL